MGSLYDRAVAQAEVELRERLAEYEGSKTRCSADGPLVPGWIDYAATYTKAVVMAYAQETLDPNADEPFKRVAHLEQKRDKVIKYLFHKYLSTFAIEWNTRTPQEEDDEDIGSPIDYTMFRILVLTCEEPLTIGDQISQAITDFWRKRAVLHADQPTLDSPGNLLGKSKSSKQKHPNRRKEVEAFIDSILEATSTRISKTDIWRVAGYTDPTQFERFQRNKNTSRVPEASRSTEVGITLCRFIPARSRILPRSPGCSRLDLKQAGCRMLITGWFDLYSRTSLEERTRRNELYSTSGTRQNQNPS